MQFIYDNKELSETNSVSPLEDERVKMIAHYLSSNLGNIYETYRNKLTETEMKYLNIVRYFIVALVDELFILEFTWYGNDYWESVLLEQQLFKTSYSGEKVFQIIDNTINSTTVNNSQKELAIVFLMVIALGFKGKYRYIKDTKIFEIYKDKLLKIIGRKEESVLPLFRNAYQHIISFPEEKRLSPLSRWYRYGLLFIVIFLIIAHFVWTFNVQELSHFFYLINI